MKGNKKILVIAVLLLLIAVSYTTYAIYKTAVAGNAEVTAAVWDVEFTDGENEITTEENLELTCSNNNHVKDGVIAPGATCTGTVTINAKTTEVDVAYSVAQNGDVTVGGSAVSSDANDFDVDITDNGTGTIAYNAQTRTATVTVTVTWGDDDDSDDQTEPDKINDADTELQGETITVPLKLVAKQIVD